MSKKNKKETFLGYCPLCKVDTKQTVLREDGVGDSYVECSSCGDRFWLGEKDKGRG